MISNLTTNLISDRLFLVLNERKHAFHHDHSFPIIPKQLNNNLFTMLFVSLI